MTLDHMLDDIYVLPFASTERLIESIVQVNHKKGHVLICAEQVERNIYFMKEGIARVYTNTAEHEITILFYKEGDTIISLKSYILNQRGYEDIELLEDAALFKLNAAKLQELLKEDIHIANWARRFAELELIKTEERFIARQFKTAKERYEDLVKNHPELLMRIQLGHIASYLGITQVSLSRIRAERS